MQLKLTDAMQPSAFSRKYLYCANDSKNLINNLCNAELWAFAFYNLSLKLLSIVDPENIGRVYSDHSALDWVTFSVTLFLQFRGKIRLVAEGMLTFNNEHVAGTEGTN